MFPPKKKCTPADTARNLLLMCALAFPPIAVITAVAAQQTVKLSSADKPQYLVLGDPAGIGQAMEIGDWRKLKTLSQAGLPNPAKAYAVASYYRSIFQIALSSKYAKQCYQEGVRLLVPKRDVDFPIDCGDLLAGNYAIEGQMAKWAKTMQVTRDSVYPIIATLTHNQDIIFPHFGYIGSRIDMKAFYDFPTEIVSGNERTNIVIPRVLATGMTPSTGAFRTPICALDIRCFGPRYYYVKASVNGHRLLGVLDTGTDYTVVTSAEAKYLAIYPKRSPFYSLISTQTSHSQAHLGYAQSIRIRTAAGHDILLRNVPVMVGGKLPGDIPIVLGLNVISRLGRLSIGQNGVIVNPDARGDQCDEPMHIQSTINGGYTIFFEYSVDGRPQDVALDTGQNQYVFGTSTASAERTSTKTVTVPQARVTGDVEASFYPGRIIFGGDSHERRLTIPIFEDYRQAYPYVIGSDILQDYDVFLDFNHGKACFNSK